MRTDNMVEHKVFPRLLALAERAWHQADWAVPYNYQGAKYSQQSNTFTAELQAMRDNQWNLFANTLGQKEFTKLELAQIDYRLPTVGAIVKEGKLHANIAFPGLTIEYQVNGGHWVTYQAPINISSAESATVKLRSRSINGVRTSRITQLNM